jgi:hypothetical protein
LRFKSVSGKNGQYAKDNKLFHDSNVFQFRSVNPFDYLRPLPEEDLPLPDEEEDDEREGAE